MTEELSHPCFSDSTTDIVGEKTMPDNYTKYNKSENKYNNENKKTWNYKKGNETKTTTITKKTTRTAPTITRLPHVSG